ncbi:hypothetical protein T261_1503 [Streptomyces lydicus]|nr:hypothetical protein T261_1503 [Streptomyces lydicus]
MSASIMFSFDGGDGGKALVAGSAQTRAMRVQQPGIGSSWW